MTFLGVFRFLLAEGEGLAISVTSNLSLAQQGEYSLVTNLCSMVCRFLYLPIEELSFNIFAKKINRAVYLASILKFLLYLGLTMIVFLNLYSYQILFLLYKSQWANTSTVYLLRIYSFYVLGMGINGQLESFVMATSQDMSRVKKILTGCSCVFVILLFLLIRIGPEGLIYANIINVTLRILFNGSFTLHLLEKDERITVLKGLIPDSKVIASFIATISGGFFMKNTYEIPYTDSTPLTLILTNKFLLSSLFFAALVGSTILWENRALIMQFIKKDKKD